MTMPVGETTSGQIRAADFPDLTDEVMYPRISAQKLKRLAEHGTRRSFSVGETLYAQGQRDAPFLVLERGRVRVLDRKPCRDSAAERFANDHDIACLHVTPFG